MLSAVLTEKEEGKGSELRQPQPHAIQATGWCGNATGPRTLASQHDVQLTPLLVEARPSAIDQLPAKVSLHEFCPSSFAIRRAVASAAVIAQDRRSSIACIVSPSPTDDAAESEDDYR